MVVLKEELSFAKCFHQGSQRKVSDVYPNCQLGRYGKRRSDTGVRWGGYGIKTVNFFVLTVMCFEDRIDMVRFLCFTHKPC